MRQLKVVICGIILVLGFPGHGNAYDVKTHRHLSKNAYQGSDLASGDRQLLLDLGLIDNANDRKPAFPNEYYFLDLTLVGKPLSIEELIKFGSEFEDGGGRINDILRPLRVKNHFYNEQNGGEALIFEAIQGPPHNWPSPDWALEDKNSDIYPQDYSYNDALGYFRTALTAEPESERQRNWGLLFQTLGHVIHHIQDMAQPQHTRNDAHSPFNSGSRQYYEWYTQRVVENKPSALPVSGYPAIDLNVFDKPRKFWDQDNGKGMAEFSSRNFVSAGTNFSGRIANDVEIIESHPNFDFPRGSDARAGKTEDIQSIPCDSSVSVCPPAHLSGEITFIETPVYDANTDQNLTNSRASSYGLFSYDLQVKYATEDFRLNRFNFDAANEFLLPRAVSYSTGLLDYFFRGRMQVELADNDDSIEITNVSRGNFAFGAGGAFEVYYETEVGERKPITSLANLNLGSDLPGGGIHKITGLSSALELIGDMGPEQEIFIIFDGNIGSEAGLTAANLDLGWNATVVYFINRHPNVFYVGVEFMDGVEEINRHPTELSIKIEGLSHVFKADRYFNSTTGLQGMTGSTASMGGVEIDFRFLIMNNIGGSTRPFWGAYLMGHDSPNNSYPEFGGFTAILGETRAKIMVRSPPAP